MNRLFSMLLVVIAGFTLSFTVLAKNDAKEKSEKAEKKNSKQSDFVEGLKAVDRQGKNTTSHKKSAEELKKLEKQEEEQYGPASSDSTKAKQKK